jgi:hypothetical protein
LSGQAIPLAGVAANTGSYNIFPGGNPSAIAWHNVIEIEFFFGIAPAAILTGMAIPQVNITTIKTNVPPRHPIVFTQ